jgi:hypothetical protein
MSGVADEFQPSQARNHAVCRLAITSAYGKPVVGPESSKTTATPDIESCSTRSQPSTLLTAPPWQMRMMLEGYTTPRTST